MKKEVHSSSLNEKQLSVTADHACMSSNMKSNYIELKLPRHGNFAAGLASCGQTLQCMTLWLLLSLSSGGQERAPLLSQRS